MDNGRVPCCIVLSSEWLSRDSEVSSAKV